MAKVVAEFDTVSKQLSVTMDGAAMENVWGAEFSRSYDDRGGVKYYMTLMTVSETEADDFVTVTRVNASESGELKETSSEKKPKFEASPVVAAALDQAISDYLS